MASIQQLTFVLDTEGLEGHTPRLAEVGCGIPAQANRAKLLRESLPLAVVHPHGLDPGQRTGRMELLEQSAFENPERGSLGNLQRSARPLGQSLNQPTGRKSIDVPVPNLSAIAKNQIAKGLDLEPVAMGQSDQPGRQQFIRQRLVPDGPQLAARPRPMRHSGRRYILRLDGGTQSSLAI